MNAMNVRTKRREMESLTKEEILALEPGLKLNLMIATEVFGWVIWEEKRNEYGYVTFQKAGKDEPYKRQQRWEAIKANYRHIGIEDVDPMKHIICGLKDWSTNISVAWEVLERFDFWNIAKSSGYGPDIYEVSVDINLEDGTYRTLCFKAKSSPEAICKAALLAMGSEVTA